MVATKRKNRIDVLDTSSGVKVMQDNNLDDEDSKTFLFSSSLGADAASESHGLIHGRRNREPEKDSSLLHSNRKSLAAKTYARASYRSRGMKSGRGKHSMMKSKRESRFMGSMKLGFENSPNNSESGKRRLSIGIPTVRVTSSTSSIAAKAALGNKYKAS